MNLFILLGFLTRAFWIVSIITYILKFYIPELSNVARFVLMEEI